MAIWKDPIFDRTNADVTFALQQIEAWKNSHSHTGDITVLEDEVRVEVGNVSVNQDSVSVGVSNAHIENEVLVVELGTIYNLKGCLNLSDIIRIEDNISYIAEQLSKYRYPVSVHTREWAIGDLPNANDMKRIANNIRAIFSEFLTPSGSFEITEVLLSYEDVNALEHNLFLLKQMIDIMVGSFILSGTARCGTRPLPIRR
jgi:hypothetical protein